MNRATFSYAPRHHMQPTPPQSKDGVVFFFQSVMSTVQYKCRRRLYMRDIKSCSPNSHPILRSSQLPLHPQNHNKNRRKMKSILTILTSWKCALRREVDITQRLLSSNASTTFGVFAAIVFPRLLVAPVLHDPLPLLLKLSLAVFASAYGFDICQQTTSVDEDTINRPSRPIPSGMLSIDGAAQRWCLSWIGSPIAMAAIGSVGLSCDLICTFAWVYFCYVWPRRQDWFSKNLFSAVCQVCFQRTCNDLILLHAPKSGGSFFLDTVIVLWLMATIHIQDFRDVEGDRKTGRKTLPVILGPSALVLTRRVTAGILWSFATIIGVLGVRQSNGRLVPFLAAVQFMGAMATGVRMLRAESWMEAERTYKLFYVPTGLATMAYFSVLVDNSD
jgi:4-hydroxybenzoate polyprenyltransferase